MTPSVLVFIFPASTEHNNNKKIRYLIIIIRNSNIPPNPARLAQSTSQFKTRMDIRINI